MTEVVSGTCGVTGGSRSGVCCVFTPPSFRALWRRSTSSSTFQGQTNNLLSHSLRKDGVSLASPFLPARTRAQAVLTLSIIDVSTAAWFCRHPWATSLLPRETQQTLSAFQLCQITPPPPPNTHTHRCGWIYTCCCCHGDWFSLWENPRVPRRWCVVVLGGIAVMEQNKRETKALIRAVWGCHGLPDASFYLSASADISFLSHWRARLRLSAPLSLSHIKQAQITFPPSTADFSIPQKRKEVRTFGEVAISSSPSWVCWAWSGWELLSLSKD